MFARRFADLRPYIPGEQPVDRQYVKLNANENPYPPSPAVGDILRNFDPSLFRLYPDPDSTQLCAAIAENLGSGLTPDMVFTGNGSDEVLSFIFYTFFDSDFPLHFPEHTYSFYPVYAGYYGIPFERIPLKGDFSIDTEALASGESTGIIFANPNAPTGIFLPVKEIRSILQSYSENKVVVVDEAYIDFGGESAISLLSEFENLVIVRTFSKSYCFAGVRLGYALANPSLIQALVTTKNSFNHFPVDALTQKIGIAACKDAQYYININRTIAQTRDKFAGSLLKAGWDVLPSKANFVFVRKNGLPGKEVYEKIKEAGILVRYFNIRGLTDFVRISIGLPADMDRLFSIMQKL